MNVHIDTLSIARDLRAAELPSEQAEAIAAAIGRSLSEGTAAKSDLDVLLHKIDSLERTMTSKFDTLDAQLTTKIESARSTLLTWLMGVIVATAGVIIAVLKL